MKKDTIVVSGGCGFIGSNFVVDCIINRNIKIINIDKLTYAADINNIKEVKNSKDYIFINGDINDCNLVYETLERYKPKFFINFAAESHVDNSIKSPDTFMSTNILGTYSILRACQKFIDNNSNFFKLIHISTDEVYGSLHKSEKPFTENNKYDPSSPYSASKAASDHIVKAWYRTYGLESIVTNCSNNYGPKQHKEKLIPKIISNAINYDDIPVYGDGTQIRDWLYVNDHCDAIHQIALNGVSGETYNIGGNCEITNLELINKVLLQLSKFTGKDIEKYKNLIKFVADRPGHDKRYAIDNTKLKDKLNWYPKTNINDGLKHTIEWYLRL